MAHAPRRAHARDRRHTAEFLRVKALAERGVASAQHSLGFMYVNGQGVPQKLRAGRGLVPHGRQRGPRTGPVQPRRDVPEGPGRGARTIGQAAALVPARRPSRAMRPAQYNLGWLYAKGQGVPADVHQAMHWFSQAAEQGDPGAQHNLGMMYEGGKGVPQDFGRRSTGTARPPSRATRARSSIWRCATTAARASQRDVQQAMSLVPQGGRAGLRAGPVQPRPALRQGPGPAAGQRQGDAAGTAAPAEQGHASSQFNLAPDLRHRPRRRARRRGWRWTWFRKAADQGHAGAQDNLGLRYEHGQGVDQDSRRAAALVPQGRRAGLRRRPVPPGQLLDAGHGVATGSAARAVDWYRKAAEQGHLRAQFDLGAALRKRRSACAQDAGRGPELVLQGGRPGIRAGPVHAGPAARPRRQRHASIRARPTSGTARRPTRATRWPSSRSACATTAATASRAITKPPTSGTCAPRARAMRAPSSTSA